MNRDLKYKYSGENITRYANQTSHPHFIAHHTGQRPHTAPQSSYHHIDYIPNYTGHINNSATVYGLSLSRADFRASLQSTTPSPSPTIQSELKRPVSEYSFAYPPKSRQEKYFNVGTILANRPSPFEKRLEQINKIQTTLLRNTNLDPFKQSNKRPKSGYAGHISASTNLYK